MTSVDSGVETGNDSNDSSIVQQKNLTPSQNSDNNYVVATTTCMQAEDTINTFPVASHFPLSSLSPLSTLSTSSSTMGRTLYSSEVLTFRYPPMYDFGIWSKRRGTSKEKFTDCRKLKSFYATQRQHYNDILRGIHISLMERRLHIAVVTNNVIMLSQLLTSGTSPNSHDEHGRTALHFASCRDYADIVRLLLEHGADPNMRDNTGSTPLHLAIRSNSISVITLLLKAGTDVSSLDQAGCSPFQLAQEKLRLLQICVVENVQSIRKELHNIIDMLLAYLESQNAHGENMETLNTLCSRLSLSSSSHQVPDDIKDLLANLDALAITS